MGIHNSKSYQINNSAIGAPKSKKKRKMINSPNKFLQQIGCSKAVKSRGKSKPELVKSLSCVLPNNDGKSDVNRHSLGHYEMIDGSSDVQIEAREIRETSKNCVDVIKCSEKKPDNAFSLNNSEPISKNLDDRDSDILKCNSKCIQGRSVSAQYPRLSETSLDSEDLMLSTDVNLDQADDDVSKDYNGSEKEDPFISALINVNPESDDNISVQLRAEDSEKNDKVYFDSSRESSSSLQRKMGYRVNCRRPHSFSTPLRTDSKSKVRRSANLASADSVDLAWTWMSASESANISQEISNLKLMLLKTKRLLLDDFGSDLFNNFSPLNENEQSIFSEPSTPIYCNNHYRISNVESESLSSKDWSNMDKEALVQELHESYNRNKSLQSQLNDKNRIIELLQDSKRRFQRPSHRTEPLVCRISRSSTFDSSATMNSLSATQDCSLVAVTFSKDSKKSVSGSKNIDSGLYQSSSSTDSNLYQN